MITFRVGMVARWGLVNGLLVAGALAGCGAEPLTPTGDAGVSPPTLLTGADLSAAVVLAADGDGIYWVNSSNQLWMLPTGSDTPRELAADPIPTYGTNGSASLLVRGNDLFWTAWTLAPNGQYFQIPLHRTQKTGGDVVLVSSCTCDAQRLTADDAHLYYPQGNVAAENGMLVALALDADPGTVPAPLAPLGFDAVLFSVAVDDQYVYWTTYPVDSTTQVGEGPVTRGEKAGLLEGKAGFSQFVADDVSALRASDGELYFVYAPAPRSSSVGRMDQNGARSHLPLPGGSTLLVLDNLVVTATIDASPAGGKIFAASAGAVADDGSVAVEIADDVLVQPVVAPSGLVFVDTRGHLLAVSARDLGAAVALGQR